METVIYIANTCVEVVQGTYVKQMLKIKHVESYPFDEGAVLDGTILNEEVILPILKEIKATDISKARLVLTSGKVAKKMAVLPKGNHIELKKMVEDELKDLNDSDKDMLYDYTILRNKIENQSGMEVLCIGVEREFVESYITLFDHAGISLQSIDVGTNAISKLVYILPEFSETSQIMTVLDGNSLSNYMYIHGNYVFSNKIRLLSEQGTGAFVSELSNSLSSLIQFKRANYKDHAIDNIYFCGNDLKDQDMVFDTLSFNLDMNVQYLEESIAIVKEVGFKEYKYVYALGALVRKRG